MGDRLLSNANNKFSPNIVNTDNYSLTNLYKSLLTIVHKYHKEFNIFLINNIKFNIFNILKNFKSKLYGFKIGSVEIKNPLITAPLAGISDNTFRIFAKAFGSSLNYTEMISSYGVYYKNKNTIQLSNITKYEKPCSIQIFGSDPNIIAHAAQALEQSGDIIDINMGCPVPKVLKTKSGGFLLTDEERIKLILKKVRKSIKKPLTIKIRLGWDKNNINAQNICKIAEDCGIDAIAIHGRTVKQGFSGSVNYDIIKNIKRSVKIPVIVSGDIDSTLKALWVLDFTGCEGLMIGRAAKGALWVFYNFFNAIGIHFLKNNLNSLNKDKNFFVKIDNIFDIGFDYNPTKEFKKEFAVLYLKFLIYFFGQEKALKEFRKHFVWIFKGVDNISIKRQEFSYIEELESAIKLISNI